MCKAPVHSAFVAIWSRVHSSMLPPPDDGCAAARSNRGHHGHGTPSQTFCTISKPVGSCVRSKLAVRPGMMHPQSTDPLTLHAYLGGGADSIVTNSTGSQMVCVSTAARSCVWHRCTPDSAHSAGRACQAKSPRLIVLAAMWTLRAVSLPFCMYGTSEAASAQSTTIAAPAYRCGPGNSLPAPRLPHQHTAARRLPSPRPAPVPATRPAPLQLLCTHFQAVRHAKHRPDASGLQPRQHVTRRGGNRARAWHEAGVAPASPVRRYVLTGPSTAMATPSASSRLPQLLCFSRGLSFSRSLRS
jgi:hypothetical protein